MPTSKSKSKSKSTPPVETVDGAVEGLPRDKHGRTRIKVDRARIAKHTLDVLDRLAAVSRRIDESSDADPEETPCEVAFKLIDEAFHNWGMNYAVARELAACLIANAPAGILLEIESAIASEESGWLGKLEEEIRQADAVALALGCDFSTAHGIVEAHSKEKQRAVESAGKVDTPPLSSAAAAAWKIARICDDLGEVEASLDAMEAR